MWIVTLVALGIALRAWLYTTSLGALDSDEAISGLAAMFLLRGEHHALLFGLYGGTGEVYLTAPFVALLGPTLLSIRIVPMALNIVACLLLWRIGRRIANENVGRLAALVFWVWPPAFIWQSMKQLAFYGIQLVCALLVTLFGLRLANEPRAREAAFFGLALGIGWWSSAQIAFLSIPLLVWLVVRHRSVLRYWAPAALFAIVGSAPWFYDMITQGIDRLGPKIYAVEDGYVAHLIDYFRQALPGALGLRVPGSGEWLLGPLAVVGYAAFGVLVVWLSRTDRRFEPIVWITVGYPFVFSASPTSWFVEVPRYLYILGPLLALLVAAWAVKVRLVWAAIAMVTTLSILGSWKMSSVTFFRGPDVAVPEDFSPLIEFLEKEDMDRAYADYWVAYRLTFEARETIIATPLSGARYQPYVQLVGDTPQPAYVFISESTTIDAFVSDMASREIPLRHWTVAGFEVYQPRRILE